VETEIEAEAIEDVEIVEITAEAEEEVKDSMINTIKTINATTSQITNRQRKNQLLLRQK
jgi:hypothetical protein